MAIPKKAVFCGVVGNILEAYDFLLFGVFASILSKEFFPPSDHSLMMTLAVFAGGFIFRPLGGLLLGTIGDYYGRKKALLISTSMMSLSTVLMGCLPSYEQIGIVATILVIVCRMIQGISVGGEYNGAAIFVVENSPQKYKGFLGSLVSTSSFVGSLLALGVTQIISLPGMPTWGWRLAFWSGLVIGILSLYVRLKIIESPEFLQYLQQKSQTCLTFVGLFKAHYFSILLVMFIAALSGSLSYTFFTYINLYLRDILNLESDLSFYYSSLSLITFLFFIPIMGKVSDKLGYERLMKMGAVATCFCSYAFYEILQGGENAKIVFCILLFGLSASCFIAPSNAFMNRLFPTQARYRGIALGFNVGMAFFGGTTPVINIYLIEKTQSFSSPSLYLIFCGFLGFLGVGLYRGFTKSHLIKAPSN